jgi:hypothetical protein
MSNIFYDIVSIFCHQITSTIFSAVVLASPQVNVCVSQIVNNFSQLWTEPLLVCWLPPC